MQDTIEIHFSGDVSEDSVLATLYADDSGFTVDANSTLRSATGLVICGVAIAAAQLAAALWQIHQANVARQEARAAARAANRAARRPVKIELHVHGNGHSLPTESQEALTRAVEDALAPGEEPS